MTHQAAPPVTAPIQPVRAMTDAEIVEFATEFREGILGGAPSWMMCFVVCAPLAGLLKLHGVEAEIIESDISLDYACYHVWLRLSDGRTLDPTADQFNGLGFGPNLPPVYLGPPTHLHPDTASPFPQDGTR